MKIKSDPLVITSSDSKLEELNFKPYHNIVERRVIPFFPTPDEPQTMDIDTPWGAKLTARKGDILASEVKTPEDYWPIDPVIFEESYIIIRPGYAVKKAVTLLVPLIDLTNDPDREVTVVTLEGPTTVRAGDFFLAKGVKGEVWAFPKEKMDIMMPDDVFQEYKKKSGGASPR